MTLIDVCEMLADWKASSSRGPNGSINKSLDYNRDRFNLAADLMRLMQMTADIWFPDDKTKPSPSSRSQDLLWSIADLAGVLVVGRNNKLPDDFSIRNHYGVGRFSEQLTQIRINTANTV